MLLLIGILMIIFDLDTLADDTHRRHFIDREKAGFLNQDMAGYSLCKDGFLRRWQPDIASYNAACGDDVLVYPMYRTYTCIRYEGNNTYIWTSRCESMREMTQKWLDYNDIYCEDLKMRPIGNTETAHVLKERWLNERCADKVLHIIKKETYATRHDIDFVFDSDPDSIAMFRQRGVYVFDCNQSRISSVG